MQPGTSQKFDLGRYKYWLVDMLDSFHFMHKTHPKHPLQTYYRPM